jgi:zinc transporter, ZIP family
MQDVLTVQEAWLLSWQKQARRYPLATLGFAIAVAAIAVLTAAGLARMMGDAAPVGARWALIGGMAGFTATALGALPGLFLRGLSQRLEDTMLGFAAGMMLAASSFSLILPALDAAEGIGGSAAAAALIVSSGLALGVMLMLGLDRFTPHVHDGAGPCGTGYERLGKVALFVLAIALHNLPEGMAIGVSFAQGDPAVGVPLTTAIALQDVPEGLAVVMALRSAGLAVARAVAIGIASGLMEPVGAVLGFSMSSGLAAAYPVGLGLAAGAMIFVVSHEVIPETHRYGHQTRATVGLMTGFAVMMVLDTTLG